jgi:hypothetical protein
MAHFIISYDLHNTRTYAPVWEKLESWGAVRLLESLWVVSLENTAIEVRDALKGVIDDDDSTAVVELKRGSMWGTTLAKKAGVDWLKANIKA